MAAIVQDWQESGLSQVEFARHHDIKPATLRYWILKQRQVTDDRPAFIPLNSIVSQGIHIRYPHGVELILPFQVPAGLIRLLIQF